MIVYIYIYIYVCIHISLYNVYIYIYMSYIYVMGVRESGRGMAGHRLRDHVAVLSVDRLFGMSM